MPEEQAKNGRCEFAEHCPMFRMFQDKRSLSIWQVNYCDGDFERCERYKRRTVGQIVDDKLLPSGDVLRFRKSA